MGNEKKRRKEEEKFIKKFHGIRVTRQDTELELITTFIINFSHAANLSRSFNLIPLIEAVVAARLAVFTAGDARLRGSCRLFTASIGDGAGIDHQRI